MKYVSANGAMIPALGFGTWRLSGKEAEEMVQFALDLGYRHVDTAQMYDNEVDIGRGLAASPVERSDIFLTTKIWPDRFRHDALLASIDESLRRLKVEYVDLLLLHWPNPNVPLGETMAALNAAQDEGKIRHIGVSNFTTDLLAQARELSAAPLVTDQVEYHPLLDQEPLLRAVRAAGMALTAYSPLAKGRLVDNDMLSRIGARHGKSAVQVTLRWLIQQEQVIAIPKSSNRDHCRANFDIFDFRLSDEEMATIHGLSHPQGRVVDPGGLAPDWD